MRFHPTPSPNRGPPPTANYVLTPIIYFSILFCFFLFAFLFRFFVDFSVSFSLPFRVGLAGSYLAPSPPRRAV